MARKKLSAELQKKVKKTKSKGRVTSAQKLAIYGDEPILEMSPDDPLYQISLLRYFNWANVTFENDLLKEFFMDYCKINNFDFREVASLPSFEFNSIGKIAYLINNGRSVSKELLEKFDDRILGLIDKIVVDTDKPAEFEEKITADQKHQMEYWKLYSEIDRKIETGRVHEDDVTKILNESQPNPKVAKMIQDHYSEMMDDFEKEFSSISPRAKIDKPYRLMIQKSLQEVVKANLQITAYVTNLENTRSSERKPRKPRARKEKPAAVLVNKMKFKKNDSTVGLNSISPESIIGAKALVVFNTQTRKFGVLYASDEKGLSVKGTTIINFDENKSLCKTLRKPAEQITQMTASTIKRLELIFNEIRAVDTKMKGRINEDVLLLKVYK